MKIKVIALTTFVSAVFADSTIAYDGVITFTDKAIAQTCTANTSDKDLAVTSSTIAASPLKDNVATSGLAPFAIRLTGCVTGMNSARNVKAYFEPSNNINLTTHNLKNTVTPTETGNIQIQLLSSNETSTILLGRASNGQNIQSETIGPDGGAILRYIAQYYATGQSITGDVKATTYCTVVYE